MVHLEALLFALVHDPSVVILPMAQQSRKPDFNVFLWLQKNDILRQLAVYLHAGMDPKFYLAIQDETSILV